MDGAALTAGRVWVVDAEGCLPDSLAAPDRLRSLFELVVKELALRPVLPPVFHAFPAPGGVTGFLLLSESHLSIHTFPERGFAAVDLYCCRPRPRWRWEEALGEALGAGRVTVRCLERGGR